MKPANFYLLETPGGDCVFIGQVRPAGGADVWLCRVDGDPLARCPGWMVRHLDPVEAQKIIAAGIPTRTPGNN